MALTVTEVDDNIIGARKSKIVNVTFDSSYATGGEAFDPATVGFQNALLVVPLPTAGYVFEYVASTKKIKAYWVDTTTDGAAMAEVASTTNLSAVTVPVLVIGN